MRGEHSLTPIAGALIGAGPGNDAFVALATLRTLRGKLSHAGEIDSTALDQMALTIDGDPPEGGEIGGDSLALTPRNFGIVNQALEVSGEPPILLELVPPEEWRSKTEIGRTTETVGQLMPRVDRAIANLLARVYASTGARGRGYGRGQHVVGRALVGNAIYHTVGDREQAIKQLALDMTATFVELAAQVGVVPYAGSAERVKANPVWYAWWTSTAAPMFKAWNAFHQAQVGQLDAPEWINNYIAYAERWQTDWPVYVQWRARLAALRNGARSIGLRLASPEPSDLLTTLPEDAADLARHLAHKAEHAADDAYDFMKIAAYGVLGLGALVGVAVIANGARGKSVKGLYR